MAKLIASGSKDTLQAMPNYENRFEDGDKGRIELNLSTSWGAGTIAKSLDFALGIARVNKPKPVTADGSTIVISFEKGMPWLAIIVAAVVGLTALWILITSWKLLKEVGIDPMKVLPFIILAGVLLVGYWYLRSRPSIKIGGT